MLWLTGMMSQHVASYMQANVTSTVLYNAYAYLQCSIHLLVKSFLERGHLFHPRLNLKNSSENVQFKITVLL